MLQGCLILCLCRSEWHSLKSFLLLFFPQTVKREGDSNDCKKPKRTKEEIEEARQLKIKKMEEEEQSRWRWFEKHRSFHLSCDPKPISAASSHAHNQTWNQWKIARPLFADSKYVFILSWSCFSSGGRKRNMRMEWSGGSWNTAGPTSLLSTNLCQTTSTSTTTVGPQEALNVSHVLVLKQWHDSYWLVICNLKEVLEEGICTGVQTLSRSFSISNGCWVTLWLMTVIVFVFALVWAQQHPTGNCFDLFIPALVFVSLELWAWMLIFALCLNKFILLSHEICNLKIQILWFLIGRFVYYLQAKRWS